VSTDENQSEIEVSEGLPEADVAAIQRGLSEHAAQAGVAPHDRRPLSVVLRGEGGALVGGLVGATIWGWLEVSLLWVSSAARGQGHGSRLLAAAEAEARRRGCHHARLDTFGFQAPDFYRRLGYRVFGTLDDCPRGQQRFFLAREL
jgi:GNAT superfamily N-acetyltransferase